MAAGEVQAGAAAAQPAGSRPHAAGAPAPPVLTPIATDRIARGFYLRYGKRMVDVTVTTLLLVVVVPLIMVLALAVMLTSGWPIFYRSSRVGLDGREFQMWKLRTMVRDADAAAERWKQTHPALAGEMEMNWKVQRDPRVTPLGTFLRRSSLDELPQFLNVLRGEMSIVGPRPYLSREALDPMLAASIVAVRPGITGPFQVRGRNTLPPIERQKLEATYWRDVGLWSDITYMLQTARPLVRLDGH